MSSEEHATASASSASGGGGGNKLVMILSLVNVIATLAIGGVLFMSFQSDKKKPTVNDIAVGGAHGDAHGAAEGGEHGEAKSEHGGGEHGGGGHGEKAAAKKKQDFGKMLSLEQFTVNLSTPGSSVPKFVRANVSIEVPTDDVEGELSSKMPQVRNAILDLMNSKRPGDLATVEGRDYLKEEIRNALNGFLVNGKVKGVFFTSFNVSN